MKTSSLIFSIILTATLLQATPPPPAMPGSPTQAPIDGGLALLAAAGGAYAWRRLRSAEKP